MMCLKCGHEMQLMCDTPDTEIYRCFSCGATVLVNRDTGEQSIVGVWRPEVTE